MDFLSTALETFPEGQLSEYSPLPVLGRAAILVFPHAATDGEVPSLPKAHRNSLSCVLGVQAFTPEVFTGLSISLQTPAYQF